MNLAKKSLAGLLITGASFGCATIGNVSDNIVIDIPGNMSGKIVDYDLDGKKDMTLFYNKMDLKKPELRVKVEYDPSGTPTEVSYYEEGIEYKFLPKNSEYKMDTVIRKVPKF